MTSHDRHPGTQLAIAEAGGVNALARLLGISSAAVCVWRRVPERHVAALEQRFAIPRHELRPDLWPPPRLPRSVPPEMRLESQSNGNGHGGTLDADAFDAGLAALARRLDEVRSGQQQAASALRDLARVLSTKTQRDERDSHNVEALLRRITAIERSLTGPDATNPTRPTRRHPRGRD